MDPLASESLGNLDEVGVSTECGGGVPLVPEELLHLPDHSEGSVVQQDDGDRQVLGDGCRELLDDHL